MKFCTCGQQASRGNVWGYGGHVEAVDISFVWSWLWVRVMVVAGLKIVWCFSHGGEFKGRFFRRCEVDVDLGWVIQAFWPIGLEDLIGSFGWCRHILVEGKGILLCGWRLKGEIFLVVCTYQLVCFSTFLSGIKISPFPFIVLGVLSFTMCPKNHSENPSPFVQKNQSIIGKEVIQRERPPLSPFHVGWWKRIKNFYVNDL